MGIDTMKDEEKTVDKHDTAPKEKKPIFFTYSMAKEIHLGKAGGQYLYLLENDKFFIYKDGYWAKMFEREFLGKIQESVPKLTTFPISTRRQIVDEYKQVGRKELSFFNWTEMLNLKNGMVSPYDGSMLDHDPNYYSTTRMPYVFNEEGKCPLWEKTLNEIFEGNVLKSGILQEFFGYCLVRETKHHKALLLLGESRSGKSTILHVLRQMIGIENCSSVPLKHISNPQATPMLINKLVNIDTDVSAKAEEFEAEFKTITSGEPIHCNQKFVDPFDFVPYCKIVMAANIFPRITDHSSAFYNRLILIPCDRVFLPEEQNRDLPIQLNQELSGILNWSIAGLHRLIKRGRFQELDFMHDAVEQLENENNPVNLFFEDHVEVAMNEEMEKGELFEKYKSWSEKNKAYILSQARFASCVFRRFHKETPKDTRNPNTKKRIWRNLKFVEFKSVNIADKGWQE